MNPYAVLNQIKTVTSEAVVMFSCGKDSIASLDLLISAGIKVKPVYCYFVQGLEIRERLLRYYEKRYGLEIIRLPHWELPEIYAARGVAGAGKKIGQRGFEDYLRAKYGISWITWGFRKGESLERRGMLKNNEVDIKNCRLYPIADWSAKHVLAYLKAKRLPLPVDYAAGFRDVNNWKGPTLLWLYRNHPEDYKRVIAQMPWVEGELLRAKGRE